MKKSKFLLNAGRGTVQVLDIVAVSTILSVMDCSPNRRVLSQLHCLNHFILCHTKIGLNKKSGSLIVTYSRTMDNGIAVLIVGIADIIRKTTNN
jgi:hypothetical protein